MALTGYQILRDNDPDALERKVMEVAADGYVPYGVVFLRDRTFFQTMVEGSVAGGGDGSGLSLTGYQIVRDRDLDALERTVLGTAPDFMPYGPVFLRDRTFFQVVVQGDVAGGGGGDVDPGGQVNSVGAGSGIDVDSSDPANPEVSLAAAIEASINSALQPGSNISDLNNDAGYLIDVPTDVLRVGSDVSDLNNDAGYITGIPADVVRTGNNVSVLTNDAGYLTTIPADVIRSGDNVSDLTNDAGYLTEAPSTAFTDLTGAVGGITGANLQAMLENISTRLGDLEGAGG